MKLRRLMAVRRYSAGQAFVEFTFTAGAFIVLTFAIMEMALAVLAYNSVSFAASEAARYAAAFGPNSPNPATTAQIQQVAITSAGGLNLTNSNVSVNWVTDANLSTRQDVVVKVTYPYVVSIPFLWPHDINSTVNLSSTSQILAAQ
ncbi:MAG TPA: TadE/TadG family type IV pilus assembly protein [Candidatus Binataceae bacterium]|nr:TadE/TadG family type IV pilus assembly protein [Candidatus Binataceae bacterium]